MKMDEVQKNETCYFIEKNKEAKLKFLTSEQVVRKLFQTKDFL